MKGLLTLTAVALVGFGLPALADDDVNPREAATGTWVHVAKTKADFAKDHDVIDIHGNDSFRKLRIKTTDAPLDLSETGRDL